MRSRIKIIFVLFLVIALGLASRKFPALFPSVLEKYPGDALWAVAVYIAWAFVLPKQSRFILLALAMGTSFLVEFSQLYHAPWIDSIRSNSIGHLFLGSTYNAMDLVAYSIGTLIAFLFDFKHKR
jgi:Protein of unknown function (DUF2809)